MGINILLADDHSRVREALGSLLDLDPDLCVVATTGSGEHAVQLAMELKPDVVVLDIELSVVNGIEATRRILRCNPRCAVVIYSMHTGPQLVQAALNAGASAYVGKHGHPRDVAEAVRSCAMASASAINPLKISILPIDG